MRHRACFCVSACLCLFAACATSVHASASGQTQAATEVTRQESVPSGIQASGLRSLIDPGGYAAPAIAAAAAGLIRSLADMRRVQNAADLSCSGLSKVEGKSEQGKKKDVPPGLDLARGLILRQQFRKARELLMSLPQGNKDPDSYRLLAAADEGTGDFEAAADSYRAAASISRQEADLFGQGYELILAGLPAKADAAFQQALVELPESTALLLGKGSAQFLLGHNAEAIAAFLKVTAIHPSNPRAYEFLGLCTDFWGEQAGQVRAALKQHLDESPSDAKAHEVYAMALLKEDPETKTAQAETLLKQAIALDPKLAAAHFQLGTLYAHQEKQEDAAREFEAVLRSDPGMEEAHYRLASALRRSGHPDAAEQEMKLFREARDRTAPRDITPFLSVLLPVGQTSANGLPCPVPVR